MSQSVQTHISRGQYSTYFFKVIPVTLKTTFIWIHWKPACIDHKESISSVMLQDIAVFIFCCFVVSCWHKKSQRSYTIVYIILYILYECFELKKKESTGNFLQNIWKANFWAILAWSYSGQNGPKNKAPWGPYSTRLWKQFQYTYKTVETFDKIRRKADLKPNFSSFWGQKRTENMASGPYFTHTWKYPCFACEPSFMVQY